MRLTAKNGLKLFTSEFLGTFIFVYLGQSSLASFELMGTQNDTINRQQATIFTYGLAFLMAALLTQNLSGSHLNPAYTLASTVFGYISWNQAFSYICAQYMGSFMAAIFLYATYSDKLAQRHSEGLLVGLNATLRAHGNILSTGKLFSSYPPNEVSLTQLFISYTLASIHLSILLIIIQESKLVRVPRCMKPVYMAASITLVQAAFSANGGPVLNPAQDFSPRIFIAMFGWTSSAFNPYHYNYWWLCGIISPHLGALIGFGVNRFLSFFSEVECKARHGLNDEYRLPRDDES